MYRNLFQISRAYRTDFDFILKSGIITDILKASGNIRDLETLVTMLRMGVARFGINLNSSVEIVCSVSTLPDGAVEV